MKKIFEDIRKDFPILSRTIYNKPLVYFDNAATTQKPKIVIDTIAEFYSNYNANIHRGVHYLSDYSTQATEKAREVIKNFINASSVKEVILTKGTTESINLVAFSFGEAFINEGDEIIVSKMEHHSNFVPWQLLCQRKKAVLKVLNFNSIGELNIDELYKQITVKTKIIAVTHVSNALGTINPIEKIIEIAHSRNVPVLIDGAQAIQHIKVDVQKLNCDFYVFSGHKIYGPTGTGVLYGKKDLLEKMPPYQGGGEMISKVTVEKTTFNVLPYKFEAGTPNYIDTIALAEAIKYIEKIGIDNIYNYETELLNYATERLKEFPEIKIIGQAPKKSAVISFSVDNVHPSDIGILIDKMGIALRTGTHCAEPIMQEFNIPGTVRVSFAFYNTFKEIDLFIEALKKVLLMLKK
ncbi:MAG: cysteine desulfurase [Bacteroidales bacterium]|jgi:cysteine desulfurase/selenocysteine lyase|nr:cysteine desulfurase [Bacteroidales bacterium]HOL97714.1 cysteine desulfurase [Bacteroidales bacterium]HOM36333.1 cysteine desulfurase [Bacteroidales bacterium]HPD23617.1 cysteine desulfurase [Bacteroidales bacterium]HRS99470.1 cysteine desulfurase [Bacteroidales bacterium]